TITTEACIAYYKAGKKFPEGMWEQTLDALKVIEERTGKKFGDRKNPLLVSVRSGAKISMPGMMQTVLNVGLNDESVKGMIELTGDPRFVYDAYRRLIQMFGDVVLGVDADKFEAVIEERKKEKGVEADTDLTAEDWKEIAERFKAIVREETGRDFPQDPYEQLRLATRAVFESWNIERAVAYREFHGIPHDLGTAVNIVTMVFGNMGWDSGTGVAFTRDPRTGEKKLFGDYLLNAQGEDVVAGIRTPKPIQEMGRELPEAYQELVRICELLERHYRDMQDLEFTIERGKLWMLQTRTGKRTAQAAVKIAVDMVEEGLITKEEAVMRIDPVQMERLLHPSIHYQAQFIELDQVAQPLTPLIGPEEKFIVLSDGKLTTLPYREWTSLTTDKDRERWLSKLNFIVMTKGVDASPGAATGAVVLDSKRAKELADEGMRVILVRPETNPDDVPGMLASQGILTARGGKTSHAAVVAR
ncbi:MAG TPA: pyruvate, phosphate dikinase, partial [Anaerolineae bacterium]|nr:pyruvate, phosphate dikinase [Anaerolineae bacterium]